MCCRSFLLGPCVAIEMILKRWSGAGDMRLRARGLMSLQASSVVGISDQRLRGSFERLVHRLTGHSCIALRIRVATRPSHLTSHAFN